MGGVALGNSPAAGLLERSGGHREGLKGFEKAGRGGFLVGATGLVGGGGSETVMGAAKRWWGATAALKVSRTERVVATSSMCEVIMGYESSLILERWRSTAARVAAAIISSAKTVSETGFLEGERWSGVEAQISDTRESGCSTLSRHPTI